MAVKAERLICGELIQVHELIEFLRSAFGKFKKILESKDFPESIWIGKEQFFRMREITAWLNTHRRRI